MLSLTISAGCRNTTAAPGSPLGSSSMLSPLAPVHGAAPLSPIQQSSGISSFGSPTRVPPPPTGSYNTLGNYGAGAAIAAPPMNDLGSNGYSRGMTDLTTQSNLTQSPVDAGAVRQTSWAADDSSRLSMVEISQPTTSSDAARSPRQSGMPVIDLTTAPYPPGYYPSASANPNQTTNSFAGTTFNPAAAPSAAVSAAANIAPIGQPTNSTFVRSGFETLGASPVGNPPSAVMAARTDSATLPTTDPFPSNQVSSGASDDLQWRRPSPRF